MSIKKKWGLLTNESNYSYLSPHKALLVDTLLKKLRSKTDTDRQAKRTLINSPLLKWFLSRSSTDITSCNRDLSMVLNTIAKERTFKPFEVITSVCDGHATINIRGLPEYVPNWFYFNVRVESYLTEFLLCNGEEYLKNLEPIKMPDLLEQFRFIRILHKFTPLEVINKDKKKFRVLLRVDTKVVNYMRGRVCGSLPIPGPSPKFGHLETCQREPEVVNSPEIIVLSPVIDKTLEKLSRIWQDTFAHAVLISAPSGSGKEELSKSIPYGNGRPTEHFQMISMADCDGMALQQRLYGDERNGVYLPGLIALAKGSALFLDEVHQPGRDSPMRASLLRTLEAGEYFAAGGIKPQKVDKVLFVMATSKRLKELNRLNPPDFWTRMTHAVEVKHPLDLSSKTKKLDVISRFFNHFWWMRVEAFYGMKPVFDRPPTEMNLDPSKLVVFWQVHSMTQIMGFKCNKSDDPHLVPINKSKEKEKDFPFLFAKIFLNECLRNQRKQAAKNFSVRGIRSIVTRLFSIAASAVVQGQIPWEEEDSFDNDVKDTYREILKIASLNQKKVKSRTDH